DQLGRAVEPLGHPPDLCDEVAGRPVRMGVVIGVAGVEHRVEQLVFGFEVMQQPRRSDAGLLGYLSQRCVAPSAAPKESLGHRKDPLLTVLALGQERVVRAYGHLTPSSNQPSEHTVGWFDRCDKSLTGFTNSTSAETSADGAHRDV